MAEKSEIIDCIEALAVHFRPPLMSVDQRAAWMADWCADLKGHSIEAIRSACRRWRQGDVAKFPTAGQLLPMVRAAEPKDTESAVGPWRPLSQPEFERLTLREKARHMAILAADARRCAGPMFRNAQGRIGARASGDHLRPEDMTQSWREWTAKAEGFEREAKQLREKLAAAKARGEAA